MSHYSRSVSSAAANGPTTSSKNEADVSDDGIGEMENSEMKTSWRAHLRYLHRAVLERLGAFLTGVITTLVAGWVTGVLDQFVPSPERTRLAVENVWRGNPQRSEEGFRIVLCWLENDAEGDNTLEVASAFQNPDLGGIKLVRSARIVVGSGAWDEWSEDMQQSVRAVLEDWDADLAIVGRVRRSGELLSLWVVPHSDEGTLGRGNRPYELDNVTLGEDFHADLRIQLAAVALAAVAPLADTEIRGRVLEKGLRDATEKLSTLLEGRAIGSAEHQAALHVALGNALQTLGDRESGTERLEQAVVAYRTALEEYTRERAPLDWAMTQNNLGNALQTLGGRESGTERLEQAVVAYRAALEEYTRERAPLDWAMTQNNLGNALQTLGGRESDTERLEQAVVAYRAALEEYTRERAPLQWAATQNNLGAALQTLGGRESDMERLEQAVVAYRAALEERTRERVPLQWAMTQNNLGNALRALGGRESDTERLEQAVVAYRAALEEYTRERVPLDWAGTQNNLGVALRALGDRESGTERLEQAVVAYRAALEERTRERVPLDWAMTQNNLGVALRALGDRESGTERLEQAVVAYRAALEERTRERVPLDWAGTQNNLGVALQALGDRESGTERLEQAVVAYRAALEEYTRERAPLDWAMTQNNLGNALRALGEWAYRAALEEYKGADPNIPDRGGRTAVHGAASIGAIETIAALLKAGRNPNRRDEDGNTPLHVAAASSQPPVMVNQSIATIRVLLNARADPNTANAAGRTPLHAAVGPNLGWPGVVRVLLDGGANPRTADGDGLTALQRFVHDAPDHGRTAAMLVEAGADPDRKYANGDAPLHAAIRRGGSRGKVEVVEALLAAGADPCIRDGGGFIPYSVAAEGGPIHRALGRAGGHDLACDKQEAVSLDLGQRRRIQEALASAGFDPGPADGEFGPRTRRAIQAWQQANGHAVTGDLTRAQAETISSPTEGPPQAAAVREAQRLLAALGYKPGSADGLWGPRTASAYGAFLRDAGLPQGKVLGQETMRTMRKIAGKRKAP